MADAATKTPTLLERVISNINNAIENEYSVKGLLAYAEDVEDEKFEDVLAAVKEWVKEWRKTCKP